MVVDIYPVAHVKPPAIHRQLAVLKEIVNHKRYQLFRELIRSVVVAATGHHHGKAESPVIGQCKHVGRSLRCRVWRRRPQGSSFYKRLVPVTPADRLVEVNAQVAIHLVGAYLHEFFQGRNNTLPHLFVTHTPCTFKHGVCPYHIGVDKRTRIVDAAVYMRFCRKIDNVLRTFVSQY